MADLLYDRQLLLHGPKRNEVLGLDEVRRYGIDSYGDPDYVSVYGRTPAAWHAQGVRLLGRTAVECTRDLLAKLIASDVAAVAARLPREAALLLDLFAGSGNTLYWLAREVPHARAVGFEVDDGVFVLTRENLRRLELPIEVVQTDYRSGIDALSSPDDGGPVIAFVAPPWGDALDSVRGLDLRRTYPPITSILELLFAAFPRRDVLCAIQVFERVEAASLDDVRACFDWSSLRVYELNAPGQNHGLLLGTRRGTPRSASSKP